jgi:REP element-mobilizing transposase RayT
MGNRPRFIQPNTLVATTTRTLHSRFLLRPSHELNTIINGVLGRAARRYGMMVCHFVVMSNHIHLLTNPRSARHLALFMNYVNGNVGKKAGRLHGWKQKFWGRRYKPIAFTDEEQAQVDGLRYLLAHGCKEGLVRKPSEWPGASGLHALITGKPVVGHWFDQTAQNHARRSGEQAGKWDFATEETLELAPLPCWAHLPPEEIRAKVLELVKDIEQETRDRFEAEDRSPMGAKRVLRQNPYDLPANTKKSPAPIVHAATLDAWIQYKEKWQGFLLRYRGAADRFKHGDRNVIFPEGCFPPRGAFVPITAQARSAPD